MGYPIEQDKVKDLLQSTVKSSMNHNPKQSYPYPPHVQLLWDDLLSRHANQTLAPFEKSSL
jgi:hypothetical protein